MLVSFPQMLKFCTANVYLQYIFLISKPDIYWSCSRQHATVEKYDIIYGQDNSTFGQRTH